VAPVERELIDPVVQYLVICEANVVWMLDLGYSELGVARWPQLSENR
jgi:hypothetical protein